VGQWEFEVRWQIEERVETKEIKVEEVALRTRWMVKTAVMIT
jgi:hypothetical protein